jgi:beta-galactosidase
MRKKINYDNWWHFSIETKKAEIPKNKGYAYVGAKVERLKHGPGAYKHNDANDSWSFDNEMFSEVWSIVNLPHDYIINTPIVQSENPAHGFFKYDNAWYRKHFKISSDNRGKRISIFFEGVTGASTVYLNGCFILQNNCGFTPFEVDITDYVRYDEENVIAVYVDTSLPETWWYYGGGIYRHVYLVITDKVAIDTYGVYVRSEKRDNNCWKTFVESTIRNDSYEDTNITIEHHIIDTRGVEICNFKTDGNMPKRELKTFYADTTVKNPELWDIDNPTLYKLETLLYKNGELCDIYETEFGYRTAEFDKDKGFLLNGRPVKIQGVCAHQDFGITGKAVPDNIFKYRVKLLKEMGVNGYRCSHYPHDVATMEALDKEGILVAAEIRHFGSSKDELEQVAMTVKRDRNRPSVICWLTGNEEMDYHLKEQCINIHRSMYQKIKSLDPSRPVSTALAVPKNCDIYEYCDFIGLNYAFKHIERIHNLYPDKAVVSTENLAMGSSLGTYFGPVLQDGRLDSRDDSRDNDKDMSVMRYGRENTWKFLSSEPWIAGGFQWDAFEHRGEATWPRLCSASGAIDMFLRKKDAFYQNKSHWTKEPMVHLVPSHWNFQGLEGTDINVWAYTNCEELELILNGKKLEKKKIEKFGHGQWNVQYEQGTLTVNGYIGGQLVATETLTTSDSPSSLRLELETPVCASTGNNIALVKCSSVDKNGIYVPDAELYVSFECDSNGVVLGTGSSNCDHVPVSYHKRKMHLGEIRIAVKPNDNVTQVRLFASAPGINKAVITIPFINVEEEKEKALRTEKTGGGENE